MNHSVQFNCSVMSDSLQPHGLQHARIPCASPTTWAHSNSCPSSWWCHPNISPLSYPSPPTFNLSQHQGLFQWVGSSHQVAKVLELHASASALPMNIQGWFPLGWADLILQFKVKVKVTQSCLTLCDPMDCRWWNSPGQNTGMGSLFLLQGIFPTQGSNPGLTGYRSLAGYSP